MWWKMLNIISTCNNNHDIKQLVISGNFYQKRKWLFHTNVGAYFIPNPWENHKMSIALP